MWTEERRRRYKRTKDERRELWPEYYAKHKDEIAERVRKYVATHKEQRAQTTKRYRLANKEKISAYNKAWHARNASKRHDQRLAWERANRERKGEYNAARRTKAAAKKITLGFYVIASRLSSCLGFPHEVDHIIPIRGKTMCGLHVPANLRVIPKTINRRKSNKL